MYRRGTQILTNSPRLTLRHDATSDRVWAQQLARVLSFSMTFTMPSRSVPVQDCRRVNDFRGEMRRSEAS